LPPSKRTTDSHSETKSGAPKLPAGPPLGARLPLAQKLPCQPWEQPDADGPWKSAVIDQLIIAHILTAEHESDPLKAIQDLLAYHTDIAVDPRVSGAAATLVEQAKAEEREACVREQANARGPDR
jgi:hypothetical protein